MSTRETPWHLRGNWEPLHEEVSATELRVEGSIPPALDGLYVRTGPNPSTGSSPHWFLGDGMVHGVRLANGRAEWYRNRFVKTPDITDPLEDPAAGLGDLGRGKGNTHVVAHAGKLLALEEAHWPFRLDANLETIGVENFNGALPCSMTAHPKVCPVTGELLAFSYFSFEPPYLRYIRIDAQGVVQQLEGIDLPKMVMMHDFNVTQNHVVFMDLPLVFDLSLLASGIPFRFDADAGARLGLMPRKGTNADVRWFEIDPCYIFHAVNAFEKEDGRVVLDVSRLPEAFSAGSDDYASVGRLWRFTLDPNTGSVLEEPIDDRPADFGRVDARRIGLPARYGYLLSLDGEGNSEEPVYGSKLLKYELNSGRCWEHSLGNNVRGGEPVFAPRSPQAEEGDGFVLAIVHDESADKSSLVILDAEHFEAPPLARVHLPQRVPYGAHGSWVPNGVLR
jgi:carotenoid cleavage dioxygenase-like enzyme